VSAEAGPEWLNVPAAGPTAGGGFLDGGQAVAASVGNGRVGQWQIPSGELTREFAIDGLPDDGDTGVAVSADGSVIAANGRPTFPVVAWDAKTGRQLFAYSVNDGDVVMGLEWSPDGQQLAIVDAPASGGRITIVDRSGSVIRRVQVAPGDLVESPVFSTDGRLVLAHRFGDSGPDAAQIWAVATGKPVAELPGPSNTIAVDPTGQWIVTAGSPSTDLTVWDAATFDHVRTVNTATTALDLAYSPSGDLLAAGGLDGVVRLWNTSTWTPLATLRGHEAFVRTVAFSPDESRLFSLDVDGGLRVWALDLDDLISIAERRLMRTMTDDECVRYLHLDRCPTTAP